jgi:hypothetical protein
MTTRRSGGREAITHYSVERRLDSPYGKFTLLAVQIDTGRTHQIRVHLASLRHPVVGDTLYGAPREIGGKPAARISLPRNFLHAPRCNFSTREREASVLRSPIARRTGDFTAATRRVVWVGYPVDAVDSDFDSDFDVDFDSDFDVDFDLPFNSRPSKVKGSGQKCPLHTVKTAARACPERSRRECPPHTLKGYN